MSKTRENLLNIIGSSQQVVKVHQKFVDEAKRELAGLEVTYSIGDRFKKQGRKYIIVIQTEGYRSVAMAGLACGCLIYGSKEVKDTDRITQIEFACVADSGYIRYWDARKKVRCE